MNPRVTFIEENFIKDLKSKDTFSTAILLQQYYCQCKDFTYKLWPLVLLQKCMCNFFWSWDPRAVGGKRNNFDFWLDNFRVDQKKRERRDLVELQSKTLNFQHSNLSVNLTLGFSKYFDFEISSVITENLVSDSYQPLLELCDSRRTQQ